MTLAYLIVFAVGLIGLVLLFAWRYAELATGARPLPHTRAKLDQRAVALFALGTQAARAIERLPAYLLAFAYFSLHFLAIATALSARMIERRAHALADFVSYKRRFERRETRSEFLKQVSEHKETLSNPAGDADHQGAA